MTRSVVFWLLAGSCLVSSIVAYAGGDKCGPRIDPRSQMLYCAGTCDDPKQRCTAFYRDDGSLDRCECV
jgi:hypothetical protein